MLKSFFNNIFGNKSSTETKTILVVDDTDSDRHLVQKILENNGFKTIAASGGRMGVELARQSRPDLVLMDYMMPELNGMEACGILKNDPQTRNIPIIFLTSMDTPEGVIKSFEKGAETFLNKPVRSVELINQIEFTFANKP